MNLMTPPEVFDGGYWYVVPTVTDPETGGQTPGDIPGAGWCAWYTGGTAVLRCPESIEGIDRATATSVKMAFSSENISHKPFGRVGGI